MGERQRFSMFLPLLYQYPEEHSRNIPYGILIHQVRHTYVLYATESVLCGKREDQNQRHTGLLSVVAQRVNTPFNHTQETKLEKAIIKSSTLD